MPEELFSAQNDHVIDSGQLATFSNDDIFISQITEEAFFQFHGPPLNASHLTTETLVHLFSSGTFTQSPSINFSGDIPS